MQAPLPLAGRYSFLRTFQGAPSGAIWLASDTLRGQTVVAATVSGPRSAGLRRIVGVRHPHLATVLEYVERPPLDQVPATSPIKPGTDVAVAEYVAGQTLHEKLETGPLPPVLAVAWLAHIAAALSAVHTRGGVHGAVSPRSIVVARTDGGVVPILTNLRAIANGAYCSPERVRGGGPSAHDDTWALHATLYTAVTGAPPFSGKTREQVAQAILAGSVHTLADYGIHDPALQGILSRGLDRLQSRRPRTAADLGRELTAWVATQTDDDTLETAAPAEFSPRSIPPPQIDDEAVTSAATHVGMSPADAPPTMPDRPAALPRVKSASSPGDHAVLAALTTKLHPPELANLMSAMGRASQPSAGEVADDDDDDDETAVMSVPELEGLRRKVLDAGRMPDSPPARAAAPSEPGEPQDTTTKDAEAPARRMASAPVVPPPAPPPDAPFDRAAPPSPGDWPARSLFESMTEEAPVPPERAPVEVVPPPPASPVPSIPLAPVGETALRQPSASATPPAITPQAPQARRHRSLVWLALLLLLIASFALGAAVVIFRDRLPFTVPGLPKLLRSVAQPAPSPPKPPASPAASSVAPPADASSAPAAVSSEPLPTPAPSVSAADAPRVDLTSCVKAAFPSDTFLRNVPLDYLCTEQDPRTIALAIHRQLVKAGAGAITGGMKTWSGLAWYELPVVAVLRGTCCEHADALVWPMAEGTCPDIGTLVDKVVASRSDADALKAAEQGYEDGIRCYFTGGLPRRFRYSAPPAPVNRMAFDAFLQVKAL
jgi:hypothetical protein